MVDKIEIRFDKKPTIKGGTFYVTINDEKTSKKYRWCIWKIHYKNENGKTRKILSLFIKKRTEKQLGNFGSFGEDGGTFIIKIYDIEKVKEKENSELSNFSEEASLEIEIKKEEEKVTTRHNITPEIERVYLSKKGSGNISKVSYQDTLIATAKTKGLEGKKITFNLYERDEKDKTHVKDFFAEVDRYGIASVEIPLLSNKKVFQLLANQKAPEYGEGNKHEFFVMASFGLNKTIKESNELQVNLTKKIKKAYFVDVNGKKVNKIQVGDSVCVRIESEDMIGALVRYTILEKDVINDDVIWVRKLIIDDDIHTDGKITITENLFNERADLGYVDSDSEKQNYYIKVEALVGKKESSVFELSFESKQIEVSKSPVKVKVGEGKVGEVKKEEKKEEPLEEGRKKHIDLTNKMSFQNQKDSKGCARTSKAIIEGTTVMINKTILKIKNPKPIDIEITKGSEMILNRPEGAGLTDALCYYQLATESDDRKSLNFDEDKLKEGMEYLNLSLEKGLPVMVGVNHTLGGKTDNEKKPPTTDHFVVIVGRTCENGQIYYPFWEVGTSKGKEGYKFKLESNNHLTCDKPYRTVPNPYTVTQIRRNIMVVKGKDKEGKDKEITIKIDLENLKEL